MTETCGGDILGHAHSQVHCSKVFMDVMAVSTPAEASVTARSAFGKERTVQRESRLSATTRA